MTEAASATLELSEVAVRVLAFATQLIACDSAVLFLRYGDMMRVYAVHQLPRELIGNEFNLASPLFDYLITTRTALSVADIKTDSRFVQILDQEQMHGWLAIPLVVGERAIGLLSLYSKQVGRFGAPEAQLMQAVARQAALALENAQLYHEATRHLQQMAILNEISTAIMSAPNFNEAMRLVMWALKRSLRYEWVNVWMLTQANDRLELVTPDFGSPYTSLRLGEGVSGQVALRGSALRLDDVRQFANAQLPPESRSLVGVPIRIGERVIGVIDAQSSQLAAFSDDYCRATRAGFRKCAPLGLATPAHRRNRGPTRHRRNNFFIARIECGACRRRPAYPSSLRSDIVCDLFSGG
jgi:GAF domain-containing protein